MLKISQKKIQQLKQEFTPEKVHSLNQSDKVLKQLSLGSSKRYMREQYPLKININSVKESETTKQNQVKVNRESPRQKKELYKK